MLDRLFRLSEGMEEPGELFVRVESLEWQRRDVHLALRPLDAYAQDRELGTWRVSCFNVTGLSVTQQGGELRLLGEDCPAVRQFLDPLRDLTFTGRPKSLEELAWNLFAAHRSVAGDWISFEKYLNPCLDVAALLTSGFGKLADGPEFIVVELNRVLMDSGLQATLGAPHRVKFWEDGAWHDVVSPLCGIAFGESWIVASGFEETPLS